MTDGASRSPRRTNRLPAINVLGVRIHMTTLEQVRQEVDLLISRHDRAYIVCAASHSIMECYRDPSLRAIFNQSAIAAADGAPLAWLGRLRGHRPVERVYGPDLMLAVCSQGIRKGYRHYLFGGEAGVADELARRLQLRLPGTRIAGVMTPPFESPGPAEEERAREVINSAKPDIVWVGLSTPKQERWMAAHLGRIEAPVMIGVGAAFDFLSGRKPQAPRWMQRSGLEWLFRLATEPRRLWPRYRQYPLFVILALAQLIGLVRYDVER